MLTDSLPMINHDCNTKYKGSKEENGDKSIMHQRKVKS